MSQEEGWRFHIWDFLNMGHLNRYLKPGTTVDHVLFYNHSLTLESWLSVMMLRMSCLNFSSWFRPSLGTMSFPTTTLVMKTRDDSIASLLQTDTNIRRYKSNNGTNCRFCQKMSGLKIINRCDLLYKKLEYFQYYEKTFELSNVSAHLVFTNSRRGWRIRK